MRSSHFRYDITGARSLCCVGAVLWVWCDFALAREVVVLPLVFEECITGSVSACKDGVGNAHGKGAVKRAVRSGEVRVGSRTVVESGANVSLQERDIRR